MFSETSEMIGAEDILAARADSPALAARIRRIIRGREDAMRALGEDIRASQPGPRQQGRRHHHHRGKDARLYL